MTDIEKEADDYSKTVKCEWENDTYGVDCYDEITDAYIAGAKAHISQWHDLRKNPDDLPKGDIHRKILVKDRLNNIYTACWFPKDDCHKEDCFSVEWLDYGFQGCNFCAKEQIIAWCEKFED